MSPSSAPLPIHPAAAVGFDRGAQDYEAARPTYPDAAVDLIVAELGLAGGGRVLDLAAGTGKLTRSLIDRGLDVVAVEPVAGMRAQLIEVLPGVPVVAGVAEALPFRAGSFDAVVAGQAFHWFRPAVALPEMARVLRATAGMALIWNERDLRVRWVHELYAMILSDTKKGYEERGDWAAVVADAGGFAPLQHRRLPFEQQLDPDGLVMLAASRSYVSSLPDDERAVMLAKVREFVATDPDLAGRDRIAVPYVTDVFWCRRT